MGAGEAYRPDIPNAARMYDYYLGGKDHFPVDREAAERVMATLPAGVVRRASLENRGFLGRSVRRLAGEFGVRQFLDLGTGLPTMQNVHEVAQSVAPDARVAYVDNDPAVTAHARALLNGNERAEIFLGDLRDPVGLLTDPGLRSFLDFSQPIAVLLVAVLHFIGDDEDPLGVVTTLMDAVPVGSYLVISHFSADSYPQASDIARVYENQHVTSRVHARTRGEVAALFGGHDLVDSQTVVWVHQWRQDAQSRPDTGLAATHGPSLAWCGVARKTKPGPPGGLPQPAAAPPAPERLSGWAHGQLPAVSRLVADPRFRPDVPNVARMYDYMLGGKDNYPADREATEMVFALATEAMVRGGALHNRRFLGRAVRYLARDLGIRQFLDIGAGLPTMNNVHEVAHAVAPDAPVVYVDNDPIVIAHARDMLNGVPNATIIPGDLRDPASILADPEVRSRLDFSQPVALLLVAILHFIADDEDPRGIVAGLMDALPAGSCLVISHASADHHPIAATTERAYDDASAGLHFRPRADIAAMLDGLRLLDPGELVWTPQWHPDTEQASLLDDPGARTILCGIARK